MDAKIQDNSNLFCAAAIIDTVSCRASGAQLGLGFSWSCGCNVATTWPLKMAYLNLLQFSRWGCNLDDLYSQRVLAHLSICLKKDTRQCLRKHTHLNCKKRTNQYPGPTSSCIHSFTSIPYTHAFQGGFGGRELQLRWVSLLTLLKPSRVSLPLVVHLHLEAFERCKLDFSMDDDTKRVG